MKHFSLAVSVILTLLISVCAQPLHKGRGGHQYKHKDMEQKIEKRLLLRVTEELDLNNETMLQLGKVFEDSRGELMAIKEEMNRAEETMEKRLKDTTVADIDLKKDIARAKELQERLTAAQNKRMDTIEKLLSPRQMVQYILIEKKFRHDMFKIMSDARKEHRGKEQ
jgi:hypothetical protein